MTIISPLPFTLANGNPADATEVMANLNQIRNDVNSNAAGGGGSGNVVGPTSAVDGHLAVFDGITGKIIKDGGPALNTYKGAVVTKSGTQSAGVGGSVVVTFDTEIIDTDNIHSGGSPTRLTVPAGVSTVRMVAYILITGVTNPSDLTLAILKNGSSTTQEVQRVVNGFFGLTMIDCAIPVVPGDYFELAAASTLSMSGTIQAATKLEMQILG